MKLSRLLLAMSTAAALSAGPAHADSWAPTTASQLTKWGKQVTPDNAWQDYPRPQMARDKWQCLNGLWDLALDANATAAAPAYDHKILVPYPVESSLSGVGKRATYLAYKRTFELPSDWAGQRVLLHFDAVDWQTSVTVNGKAISTLDGDATHFGGYDRFSYDITSALKEGGAQEVAVSVFDPTDRGDQPRGKQVDKPHGIWYTPTSGIWQSVWLEPVAKEGYIRKVSFVPDAASGNVKLKIDAADTSAEAWLTIKGAGDAQKVAVNADTQLPTAIENPTLWSPENPHLYETEVTLKSGDKVIDKVKTYFAFRTIEKKTVDGVQRILLNGKPIFMLGTLDQGFWPDGLHTPPSREAMEWDIDYTRDLGFNLIRKHIKVEPDTWYYHCDKTGMLVWQDCVNGVMKTDAGKRHFEKDMERMMLRHSNSPAIVLWVVFNEGWGQYDTERMTDVARKLDSTRLITSASGWYDRGTGDIFDMHKYPGPGAPDLDPNRAGVLGEFGGLGLKVEGHTWSKDHWGYQGMENAEQLFRRYSEVISGLRYLRAIYGLNAAIYTQTTDVEIEANGLVTYDREVKKMDTAKVREVNQSVITMAPLTEVFATALKTSATKEKAPVWKYTLEKPADEGWEKPGFDDTKWKAAPAGFGDVSKRVFGPVHTEWNSAEIYMRRKDKLPADVKVEELQLNVVVVDEADIFINGVKAAEIKDYVTGYTPVKISAEALATVKPGEEVTIAIHGRNVKEKDFGQYMDAGLFTQK